ncbi:MAG: response regulator receiver modulated CheB methylesterase [Verrucomicrobiales bacterium]|nr:response regulator receiver modulated CheB methylesterase [Verrucomicrobiales bacterium]
MNIAIVNDSPMACEALRRVIVSSGMHHIAWMATDGNSAVEQTQKLLPDLILMDMIMPVMDGVDATRIIMSETPCPILVVTASVDANSNKVYQALGFGAMDAVNTPVLNSANSPAASGAILLEKISILGKLFQDPPPRLSKKERSTSQTGVREPLIVIGCSAGGPAALSQVLSSLPADFNYPIVIIQHLDSEFASGLCQWLASKCRIPVNILHAGTHPEKGTALLAGTNDHLVLREDGQLYYQDTPIDLPYRPSVDVFFESVALHWKGSILAVILTGMGRDGALGTKAIRDAGGHTIVQNKESSLVFGMPKATIALGAAVEILALNDIGPGICSWASALGTRPIPISKSKHK